MVQIVQALYHHSGTFSTNIPRGLAFSSPNVAFLFAFYAFQVIFVAFQATSRPKRHTPSIHYEPTRHTQNLGYAGQVFGGALNPCVHFAGPFHSLEVFRPQKVSRPKAQAPRPTLKALHPEADMLFALMRETFSRSHSKVCGTCI